MMHGLQPDHRPAYVSAAGRTPRVRGRSPAGDASAGLQGDRARRNAPVSRDGRRSFPRRAGIAPPSSLVASPRSLESYGGFSGGGFGGGGGALDLLDQRGRDLGEAVHRIADRGLAPDGDGDGARGRRHLAEPGLHRFDRARPPRPTAPLIEPAWRGHPGPRTRSAPRARAPPRPPSRSLGRPRPRAPPRWSR